MGYLVALTQKIALTDRINKLEFQLSDMTTMKMNLSDTVTALVNQISDIGNSDSPAVKQLEARKAEIQNLENQIDVRMQKIQAQLQAANAQMQSVDQMLQQGIQRTFTFNVR